MLNIGCRPILYFVTMCGKYIRLWARHRKAEGYVNSRKPQPSVTGPKVIQRLTFVRIDRYSNFGQNGLGPYSLTE